MTDARPSARSVERELIALGSPEDAAFLQRFFRTGPGEYGEGDVFLGIRVPVLRTVVKRNRDLSLSETIRLLQSKHHEARVVALLILVEHYRRGSDEDRAAVYDACLANTARINNWDLVDCSASAIVGAHLDGASKAPLTRLAKSKDLWQRRIAIVSTHYFIRQGVFSETLRIAEILLHDKHDLIHKATGWMLREVGNRDGDVLRSFLGRHYHDMPRTMLRYAIEKFPEKERKSYLAGTV